MAVYQSKLIRLTDRYREQARSHSFYDLPDKYQAFPASFIRAA
jgi:hypothetical protein